MQEYRQTQVRNRRSRTAPLFYALGAVAAILAIAALINGSVGGFLLALGFTVFFVAVGGYFQKTPGPTAYERRPASTAAEPGRTDTGPENYAPPPGEPARPETPDDRRP